MFWGRERVRFEPAPPSVRMTWLAVPWSILSLAKVPDAERVRYVETRSPSISEPQAQAVPLYLGIWLEVQELEDQSVKVMDPAGILRSCVMVMLLVVRSWPER